MNTELHFSTGQDIWETPQSLFNKLNDEFSFNLDAAANEFNKKCNFYFHEQFNALDKDWCKLTFIHTGKLPIIWCNPPYSRKYQAQFIRKAHDESQKGATVVMLLPARTDTKVFHEVILPNAEVRFIKGRLKFGNAKHNAPFPSMVVVFRPKKQVEATL